ncbi:MAG: hypothetical protein J0I87_00600, partial [Cellulomonas sp.]|nr:hypothetical protein [Cellulomonas sp.]
MDDESRIRSPRIEPELDDLAVGVQVFIQAHLVLTEEAEVADDRVVLAAEREGRLADRLQSGA